MSSKSPLALIRGWRHQFIRSCILNDAYKPHTPKEIAALVEQGFMTPDVAAQLDPERSYGIWWYEGRDFEGNEHRVAVPVPDSGVPREVVDAARAAIVDNVPISAAGGDRFWELLGGITRCGGCGLRMQAHAVTNPVGRVYYYMRCPFHDRTTPERCPVNARIPAEKAEEAVWRFVSKKLVSPDELIRSLDGLIAAERRKLRGDPEAEVKELRRNLSALDQRRERAQDAYLAGVFSVDELRGRQQQLDEARVSILREIDACENRGSRIAYLRELREDFVGFYGWIREDELEEYTPEQRHGEYRNLELRVDARSKDELEVSGVFRTEKIYTGDPSPRPRRTATTLS